jgi:hypothetical protein
VPRGLAGGVKDPGLPLSGPGLAPSAQFTARIDRP